MSSQPSRSESGETNGNLPRRPREPRSQSRRASYTISRTEEVENILIGHSFWDRDIHGFVSLPPGYGIAILPSNAVVVPNVRDCRPAKVKISCSQNI